MSRSASCRNTLLGLENSLKVYRGLQSALLDDTLMHAQDQRRSANCARACAATRSSRNRPARAWDDIAQGAGTLSRRSTIVTLYLESGTGFNTKLFGYARQLVRGAAERAKPNEQRLREYADSNLPKISAGLLAATPIYPEFEKLTFSFSLDKMREIARPGRRHRAPAAEQGIARVAREQARARDEARRSGGAQGAVGRRRRCRRSVAGSDDRAGTLDRSGRARAAQDLRRRSAGAVAAGQEKIAKARFAVLGTNVYPDATFTLRLSYGDVRSWVEKGQQVEPFTKLSRLYERTTGQDPFRLPQRWLDARSKLDPNTPFNYVTTNDIVGGNSGSPLVDAQGRLVGLLFDGNIHSIAGTYWYDESLNRAVAVHPAIILAALREVYGAQATRDGDPRRPRGTGRAAASASPPRS